MSAPPDNSAFPWCMTCDYNGFQFRTFHFIWVDLVLSLGDCNDLCVTRQTTRNPLVYWNSLLLRIAHTERSGRGSLGITQSAHKSIKTSFQNHSECVSIHCYRKVLWFSFLFGRDYMVRACHDSSTDPMSNLYTVVSSCYIISRSLRAPLGRCITEHVCVFVIQV